MHNKQTYTVHVDDNQICRCEYMQQAHVETYRYIHISISLLSLHAHAYTCLTRIAGSFFFNAQKTVENLHGPLGAQINLEAAGFGLGSSWNGTWHDHPAGSKKTCPTT